MTTAQRRIRIGIDTGGTFTDIVAFDEDSGTLTTTKTPSTPANPADGFITGIDKVLAELSATGADIAAVSHGTTVATNQLLEGKLDRLGFITTEGYEFILEIARQAVPDGYGNSYFWVKPGRIVPADLVKTVAGRMDFEGNEVRPFDEPPPSHLVSAAGGPGRPGPRCPRGTARRARRRRADRCAALRRRSEPRGRARARRRPR